MLTQIFAEAFGTFSLVLIGTGSIALGMFDTQSAVGLLGSGLAFGLATASMLYLVGPVSGAHINPSVSIGFFLAGKLKLGQLIQQTVAQFAGAIAAGAVIVVLAHAKPDLNHHHLGASGWRWGSHYPWWAAFVAEIVATFIFVTAFITTRQEKDPSPVDGIAIGMAAAGLHFAFGPISSASLNPARSFGSAIFAGPEAWSQLWLYLVAPTFGAIAAGLLARHVPLISKAKRSA